MANFTRMISLNRDNIVHMTSQPEFFTKNPGLADLEQRMADCRAAFDTSAKKAGCRCRADTTLLTGCVSAFLETLENAKQENPEIVQQFVKYAAKADDITGTGVTIFYVRPNETTPTRYQFP